MSHRFDCTIPSDICVLLRADAEQSWLNREVIPVLRQIETREQLPDELIDAALAYLETTWDEARIRAHATDAAHSSLHTRGAEHEALSGPADRYHAAVRVLRRTLSERVIPLTEPREDDRPHLGERGRPSGGCAPQAA
jgi:hypothetical protein